MIEDPPDFVLPCSFGDFVAKYRAMIGEAERDFVETVVGDSRVVESVAAGGDGAADFDSSKRVSSFLVYFSLESGVEEISILSDSSSGDSGKILPGPSPSYLFCLNGDCSLLYDEDPP